jgi:tRNA pseudouridine55 synthase
MNEARYTFNLYKRRGETPLECLLRFKADNSIFENVPFTYVGRLDPLASGVMPIIGGRIDESKKNEILNLPKKYKVEILFGLSSDTGDVLGLPSLIKEGEVIAESQIEKALTELKKLKLIKYPVYSSRPVDGKPLWQHAREGSEVSVPTKSINIYEAKLINTYSYSSSDLLNSIHKAVREVKGDFRQDQIINKWEEVLVGKNITFQIAECLFEVSTGTYIRVLAEELGMILNVPALAYKITRTQVGNFTLKNAWRDGVLPNDF